MTHNDSPAVATARAYHRAWSSHDFERAMTYIADDIVCLSPAGRLDGADAFRDFMGPFVAMVTRAELVAAFGNETSAVLVYDTETSLVNDAPGAEHLTVEDGTITHMRIIFDRLPFAEARRAGDR